MKVDNEAKFQGVFFCVIAKLRNIEFSFGYKTTLPVTCYKGTEQH